MLNKFPFFPQIDQNECGLTCIQMISSYYGNNHQIETLRSIASTNKWGLSIAQICDVCNKIGLKNHAIKCNISQLVEAPFPCILHWNSSHYVVLYKVSIGHGGNKKFHLSDPAFGRVVVAEDALKLNWQNNEDYGIAIILQPSDDFLNFSPPDNPTKPKSNIIFKDFAKRIKKNKSKLFCVIALTLLASILNWIIPILYQKSIDIGVSNNDISTTIKLLLAQLSFFIGVILSSSWSSFLTMKTNFIIGIEFVQSFIEKTLKLPMSYFDRHINTDFIQRIEDHNRLQQFLTTKSIDLGFALLNTLIFASILFYYSKLAFLFFFCATLLTVLWNSSVLKKRLALDYQQFSQKAKNKNILFDIVNGVQDIKVSNSQSIMQKKWAENQRIINDISLKSISLNYRQVVGTSIANRFRDFLIVALCAYLTIVGDSSLGVLLSVSFILGQLTSPTAQLQYIVFELQDAKISAHRIASIQHIDEEDSQSTNPRDLPSFENRIVFDNVSFNYGFTSRNTLSNLHLDIPKNKTTAIVGASGCGKTTLIKLLLGLYKPQHGEIFIDETPLSQINVSDWRRSCGVVMQEGQIFSGTIAENIIMGESVLDAEKLSICVKTACLDEFVNLLPMGLKTPIGSSGISVSKGQAQRILIARALYKDANILILDEATSSLDTINEKTILSNIKKQFAKRTAIIIAHRLSTVVDADNIILMDNGTVAEQGSHDQLIAKKGKYFNLVKNQLALTRQP